MKLWLLTHLETNDYTQQTLLDTCAARGHEIERVNPLQLHCGLGAANSQREFAAEEKSIDLPEGVVTRMGATVPDAAIAVLRELERLGVCSVNSWRSLEESRDQIRTIQAFAERGIPTPQTMLLGSKISVESAAELVPGPPWILKLPVGALGRGVMMADSLPALRSMVNAFHSLHARLILQEFVDEARMQDLRVLVIGGKATAAMRRTAGAGEFRANIARGGTVEALPLNKEISSLAERAADAVGLEIAGIDLIESSEGLLVLEANGSPGLDGLQSVTEHSLAEQMVAHIEHCLLMERDKAPNDQKTKS